MLAHDSTAAGNVYVTVDPTASDTVFDGGLAQTGPSLFLPSWTEDARSAAVDADDAPP